MITSQVRSADITESVEICALLAAQRDAPHRDVDRSRNLDEASAERVDLVSANSYGAELISHEVRRE